MVKTVVGSITPIPIPLSSPEVNCPTKADGFSVDTSGLVTLAKLAELFQLLNTIPGLLSSKSMCIVS